MIIEILEKIINETFQKCGYLEPVKVIKSNRLDLCDYQCDDIFKMAKIYHENPIEIGNKIVDEIKLLPDFNYYFNEVIFVKPGFLNIIISDSLINKILNKMINSDNFGLKINQKETYFLDYGGPNIAKPLHVGHLRPAIIGESIKRIINFVGHQTISDVHLGDYGLQIGQVIYAIIRDNKKLEDITLDYLEYIYPYMSKLCKEDESILTECAKITKDLQDGNEYYHKLWKVICQISSNDIKRIYKFLDVSFDIWNGESDEYQYLPALTKELNKHKLLKDSEGAKIIEVKQCDDSVDMPPLIYQKSNGAYLYGSTDMATIYGRVIKYDPEHILYVVDARQSLHFTQVFRACKLLPFTSKVDCKHLGLGTVNGSDGKPFKTRSGDTVKLDDLFNIVREAFISAKDTNQKMSNKDLDILVNSIIKFADLQNNREKDYIFDISKFSSINGKTGPYILYTYLRMDKLLTTEEININQFNDKIYNRYDRDLRLKLIELDLSINNAFEELLPSHIADYIYDVCVLDNVFYQQNNIRNLTDEKQQQWLLLIEFNNKILKQLFELLIIKIPSEM